MADDSDDDAYLFLLGDDIVEEGISEDDLLAQILHWIGSVTKATVNQ